MSDLSSRIIGPLLVANLINWGLYGLFVLQSYIYLTTSPKLPPRRNLSNNELDNIAMAPLTRIRTDVEYAAASVTSPISPSTLTNRPSNDNFHHPSSLNPRIPHQKLILSIVVFLLFFLQTVQLLLGSVYVYWLATNAPMDLSVVNDPVKMRLIITAACIIGPIVYIFIQLVLAYRIYLICTVPLLTLPSFSQQNNRKLNQSQNNNNIYHIKKPSTPSHLPNLTQPQSQNQHIYPPQSSFITFSRSNSNLGARVFLNRMDFRVYFLWSAFIFLLLAVAFCGVARGAQLLRDHPTYEQPIPLTATAGFWLVGTVAINLVVFIYLLVHFIHSGALDISKPTTIALRVLGESGFAQLVLSIIALAFAAANTSNQNLLTTSAMFSVFLLLPGVYNNTVLLNLSHSYAHTVLRTPYGSGLRSQHRQRVHKPSTASSTAVNGDGNVNMLRERGSKSKLRNGYTYPFGAPDEEWNCVPASDFRRSGVGRMGMSLNVGAEKSDGAGNNIENANPNFGTKGMFRRSKSKSVSKVIGKNPTDRFMCRFVTRMGRMGSSIVTPRPRPRHAKRGSVSRRISQRTFSAGDNRVSVSVDRAGQDGGRVSNLRKKNWVRLGADAFNNFSFKGGSEKEKEAYPEWDSGVDESVGRGGKRPNVVGVDADGVITLDLRKMSEEHERRMSLSAELQGQRGREEDAGADVNADGNSLNYSFARQHPPAWIELQRDVNGSGSGASNGNANDATGLDVNKSSSEVDTWKRGEREDPSMRRRPKGPRSSAAGTSLNAQILRDLQAQGSVESFDDLPVFRARPGYGSGSEWETDYEDEFWSDGEDDAGSDVDARVATPIRGELNEANSTWSTAGLAEQERERIMQQTGLSWIPAQQRPDFRSLMSLPNQAFNSRPNPAGGVGAATAQGQDDSSVMIISAVPEPSFVEPSMFRAASVAATRASTGSEWSSWTYPKPTALPDLDEDLQDGMYTPGDGESTRAHPSASTPSNSNGTPVGLADGDYEGEGGQEGNRRWRVHPLKRMVEMGRLKW